MKRRAITLEKPRRKVFEEIDMLPTTMPIVPPMTERIIHAVVVISDKPEFLRRLKIGSFLVRVDELIMSADSDKVAIEKPKIMP